MIPGSNQSYRSLEVHCPPAEYLFPANAVVENGVGYADDAELDALVAYKRDFPSRHWALPSVRYDA
jgi:hypothetical protein